MIGPGTARPIPSTLRPSPFFKQLLDDVLHQRHRVLRRGVLRDQSRCSSAIDLARHVEKAAAHILAREPDADAQVVLQAQRQPDRPPPLGAVDQPHLLDHPRVDQLLGDSGDGRLRQPRCAWPPRAREHTPSLWIRRITSARLKLLQDRPGSCPACPSLRSSFVPSETIITRLII